MMQRQKNGIESSPLKAESLERNWMGPERKNFAVPKAEEKMLNMNVTKGNAEFKSWKNGIVRPDSSFG